MKASGSEVNYHIYQCVLRSEKKMKEKLTRCFAMQGILLISSIQRVLAKK